MIIGMRRARWDAAAVALGLAASVGGAYLYARWSLPLTTGTIAVAGLSAPVEIVRDRDAITHVFAATKADGRFGLGYAQAQDRLAEDDGLGSQRQLRVRVAAPRSPQQGWRGRRSRSHADVPGGGTEHPHRAHRSGRGDREGRAGGDLPAFLAFPAFPARFLGE